jgi:hypothetical protein
VSLIAKETISTMNTLTQSRSERRAAQRQLRRMVCKLAKENHGRTHSGRTRGVAFEPGCEPVQGKEVLAAVPANVAHPFGPPVVSGTTITVETMLQQPTRITRMIMDMTLQRFIADRVFASGGGVQGGAVIYDTVQANELYTNRDVERVAPGAEFPILTSDRRVPNVAEVEKWGGKVWISDEARDRNDAAALINQVRQVGNTVVRKINARTIQTLEASITSSGQTATGRNWSTAIPYGATPTAPQQMPVRDFAMAALAAEEDELGVRYDLWLLNPQDYTNLIILYGADGLNDLLDSLDLDIYVSNRVTPGTAYALQEKGVGQMRIEKPLGTETWREPNRERTWIQTSVRPLFFADNPFAVLKFTGLQG